MALKYYAVVHVGRNGKLEIVANDMGEDIIGKQKGPAQQALLDVRDEAKHSDEAQRFKLAEIYIQ